MKKSALLIKIASLACATLIAVSAAGCGCNKSETTNAKEEGAKYLTDKGYQMPYEYEDGYVAYMKTLDGSDYETISTTNAGNKVVHLKTDKSEEEVQAFYDDYFKDLKEVKAKLETDHSVGYYDEENRIVVFNLVVWTADGRTNYKMGCAPCDDINNDPTWELKTDDNADDDNTETTVSAEEATE